MAETQTYYYSPVPVALPQGYVVAQPNMVPVPIQPQAVPQVTPQTAPQIPTQPTPQTPLQVPTQGIHEVVPQFAPDAAITQHTQPQPAQPSYIPQPLYIQAPPAPQVMTPGATQTEAPFDYSYVHAPARIAIYDDLLSEPRVITIAPAPTTDFIGSLAATIWQQIQALGGNIAYSIILQVTENFIHARFSEMVVSIFNNGKTIRFADQGPGFKNKEMALQPGFSSATQPMKQYIKGVGSGLPSVQEWLHMANAGGRITIEDNLNGGAVVTLSLTDEDTPAPTPVSEKKQATFLMPALTPNEKQYILCLYHEGALRVTDVVEYTNIGKSSVSTGLKKLRELRLVENEEGTSRRTLTKLGMQAAERLLREENEA